MHSPDHNKLNTMLVVYAAAGGVSKMRYASHDARVCCFAFKRKLGHVRDDLINGPPSL